MESGRALEKEEGGRDTMGRGRPGEAGPGAPSPTPAHPHLVLGQQLAPPVGVGDVVQGEAQVVVTVLEQQRFGLLHQVAPQCPLQLQHFLRGRGGLHHAWASGPFLLAVRGGGRPHLSAVQDPADHSARAWGEKMCGQTDG